MSLTAATGVSSPHVDFDIGLQVQHLLMAAVASPYAKQFSAR